MLYTQVHRLALWFLRERGGDTFRISPRGGVGEGQEPRVTVAGRDIHDRLSRDWKVAGARCAPSPVSRPLVDLKPRTAEAPQRRGSLLTGHWAHPQVRGRRRARPARPRRTSPPCRLRSRRCPRCGLASCLAAATEARAQARHSPMSAARRVPAGQAVPAASPG